MLVNGLSTELPRLTNAVSPQVVIKAGPLAVGNISKNPEILLAVRQSYSFAISHVFIFATAIICLSIPLASGMQWLNLNRISKEREALKSPEKDGKQSAALESQEIDTYI